MLPERATIIADIADRTIGERKNAQDIIGWVRENPNFLLTVMQFDSIIARFNITPPDAIPQSHINASALKAKLGATLLPTIGRLMAECDLENRKRFFLTSKRMNEMMHEGEKENPQEPYLAFHIQDIDTEARGVGTIFHYYEECLMGEEEYQRRFQREDVVCALVETLSENKENPLYDAVANPKRLNWINDYEMFSREFREEKLQSDLEVQRVAVIEQLYDCLEYITQVSARPKVSQDEALRLGKDFAVLSKEYYRLEKIIARLLNDEGMTLHWEELENNIEEVIRIALRGNYTPLRTFLRQDGQFRINLAQQFPYSEQARDNFTEGMALIKLTELIPDMKFPFSNN